MVKYALKELLGGVSQADEILNLTVCEPALGSGAFLNEALNQLADAYLERKQGETKQRIPEGRLDYERQRVKAFLADNRVFGVDKNPIAVELAEISLWLNTMYEGQAVPWFGGQLKVGNSLIGARRQIFWKEQVTAKERLWLEAVPKTFPLGAPRPADGIYHFLLPDEGMSAYNDKVVKGLCPVDMKLVADWRKTFRERFDDSETQTLVRLSEAVDRLWKRHTEEMRQTRLATAHQFPVWPEAEMDNGAKTLSAQEREAVWKKAFHPRRGHSSDYERLKFVMDYWCALWFWPIEKSALLPSRHEFLLEVGSVLEGTYRATQYIRPTQGQMFSPEQASLSVAEEYGFVDVAELCRNSERLQIVKEIARTQRFFHWDLEFADVFADRGGFDLMLGNPPWIKIEWNEGAVMGDLQPLYVLRSFQAPQLAEIAGRCNQKS